MSTRIAGHSVSAALLVGFMLLLLAFTFNA